MIPKSWIVDLMCFAVAVVFLKAAITGNFYSSGRGRRRLVASVTSVPARVVFFLVSIGMFVLFDWLLKHRTQP
jgi:hypothetical protein